MFELNLPQDGRWFSDIEPKLKELTPEEKKLRITFDESVYSWINRLGISEDVEKSGWEAFDTAAQRFPDGSCKIWIDYSRK